MISGADVVEIFPTTVGEEETKYPVAKLQSRAPVLALSAKTEAPEPI